MGLSVVVRNSAHALTYQCGGGGVCAPSVCVCVCVHTVECCCVSGTVTHTSHTAPLSARPLSPPPPPLSYGESNFPIDPTLRHRDPHIHTHTSIDISNRIRACGKQSPGFLPLSLRLVCVCVLPLCVCVAGSISLFAFTPVCVCVVKCDQ